MATIKITQHGEQYELPVQNIVGYRMCASRFYDVPVKFNPLDDAPDVFDVEAGECIGIISGYALPNGVDRTSIYYRFDTSQYNKFMWTEHDPHRIDWVDFLSQIDFETPSKKGDGSKFLLLTALAGGILTLTSDNLLGKLTGGGVALASLAAYADYKLFNGFSFLGDEIGAMKVHKFIPVYSRVPSRGKPGRSNIHFAKGKSGVYLIKENGKTVYVGQSQTDLYRTAIRHFQEWNDKQQPQRITYKNNLESKRYTIRIVLVSPTRAVKLEEGLIKKYRPRDNFEKLSYIDQPSSAVNKIVKEYQEEYADEVPF